MRDPRDDKSSHSISYSKIFIFDLLMAIFSFFRGFSLRGIRASPFHLLVHDRSQATSTVDSSWMGDLPGVVPSKSTALRSSHRQL